MPASVFYKNKADRRGDGLGANLSIQFVVQLLVLVEEARTTKEVANNLASLLKTYGFEFYAIVLRKGQTDPEGMTLISRWPDSWVEVYRARKYTVIDPVMRMLNAAHRPFRWRDSILALKSDPHRSRMDRMMQEAGRHGLDDGYVFPIHGRNGFLGNMIIGGKPIDLSPTEISLFDTAAKRIFWRLLEIAGDATALEASARLDTQLTRREMEVMALLADGMTSHEIARSLDISNHTVDWYIHGLQEKLKAKNRQHVVAMAFRHGLVT